MDAMRRGWVERKVALRTCATVFRRPVLWWLHECQARALRSAINQCISLIPQQGDGTLVQNMPMPMPMPLLTTGTRPKNTLPRIHNSPSSGRTRTPPPPRRVLIPSRLAYMRWGPSCAAALRSPARGSETNAEPDAKPPPPAAAPKGITAYVLGGQCLVFISQTQSQCFHLFLPFPHKLPKELGCVRAL